VGARAEALGGLLPSWILGGALFGEWASAGRALVSPSVRLSVLALHGDPAFPQELSGHFTWIVGRVEGCPLRLRFADRFSLTPCLAFDVGAMLVRGAEGPVLTSPNSQVRTWTAVVPLARAAWEAGAHWNLELGAGLAVALMPYSFGYELPNSPSPVRVYQVNPVGADFSLGAAYLFQ
jgi:hypothetical protein